MPDKVIASVIGDKSWHYNSKVTTQAGWTLASNAHRNTRYPLIAAFVHGLVFVASDLKTTLHVSLLCCHTAWDACHSDAESFRFPFNYCDCVLTAPEPLLINLNCSSGFIHHLSQ